MATYTNKDWLGANYTAQNGDILNGRQYNMGTFYIPAGRTVYVQKYSGASGTKPWYYEESDPAGTLGGWTRIEADDILINGILTAKGAGYIGGNGGKGGRGGDNYGQENGSVGQGTFGPVDNGGGVTGDTNGATIPQRVGGYNGQILNREVYPYNYSDIGTLSTRQRLYMGGGGGGGNGGAGASGGGAPTRHRDDSDCEDDWWDGGFCCYHGGGGGGAGARGGGFIKLFANNSLKTN